jgi:TRAP-type C4-dicarboxylate transport system substrate-binding protein
LGADANKNRTVRQAPPFSRAGRALRGALAAAALLLAPLAGPAARAQDAGGATELKFGTLAPDNTPWSDILKSFKKNLQKATQGKVRVKLYLNGVLGDEAAMLQKMKFGQLTGGGFSTGGISTVVPALQIFEVPFLFDDDDEADYVMDNVLLDDMRAACEEKGLYLYIWAVNGWLDFGSKDRPLLGLDDLRGAKAFMQETDVQRAFWEAVGASPVPLPVPDVLSGLQRGMITCYTSTPIFASAAQWFTQTKHWTRSHQSYQPAAVVFDLKWWQGLPDDLRKTIISFGPDLQKAARKDVRGIDADILTEFKKSGIEIHDLSPDSRTALKKACERVPADLVKAGDFKQETFDKVVKALADLRAKKGSKG